jgi:hypothetical protein
MGVSFSVSAPRLACVQLTPDREANPAGLSLQTPPHFVRAIDQESLEASHLATLVQAVRKKI